MHPTARLSAALLALCLASAAGAQTSPAPVTTSAYWSGSVANDIDLSCKQMKAGTGGTVSGKCNKNDGNSIVTNDTSVDTTDYVGCGWNMGKKTKLRWGDDLTQWWSPKEDTFVVKLNSTGKRYVLAGKCVDTNGWVANESTIEFADSDLDNDKGELAF